MFRRFFAGRYGNDQLNFAIFITVLVLDITCFFISGIVDLVLTLLATALLVVLFCRMLSRNFYARQAENRKFLAVWYKIKPKFNGITSFFKRLADRKHKYFKCPNCKTRLRVPRGRGSITVTCPLCKNKFDKNS